MGSLATPTLNTRFPEPENLGRHGYRSGYGERKGVLYSCRAGHIDIVHLRASADWTAFLAAKTYRTIMKGQTEFSFNCKEKSVFFVKLFIQ